MIKIVLVLNEYTLRRAFVQVLVGFSFMLNSAQAQQRYEGQVRDQKGGLQGVQVSSVLNGKLLVLTDSNGLFSFESEEINPLVNVHMLGYYELQLKLYSTYNQIVLVPKVNLLDQVVISEGKMEKEIKRTTVTLDVIQPELIQQTSPLRIQQSINRLNGVQIVDGQANIRSGSGWSYGAGSRVQVMVNGLPFLSADAAQPQWSFIPTEGVERVEVIKGSSSVIYGSSALNGVINIETKTHSVEPFTQLTLTTGYYDKPARAGLRYQDKRNNVSNANAFHLDRIGGLDYHIGINMLYDEGYKMNDDELRARTTFGLRKLLADKNMIYGVNAGFQMGRTSSFLLWENYEMGYTSMDSSDTENNSLRLNIDPYFTWNRGNVTHKLISRYLKVSNGVDNGDSTVDQSNYSDLVYAEYQYKWNQVKRGLQVIGGVVAQGGQTRSPLFNGKQSTNNAAVYLQGEKQWNKFLLNAGLRYEYFRLNERAESKPVFRAGMNYEAAKATFVRASIGQGFRFPSVAETFITTRVGPVTIYPNPDLLSESGYSWELGLKQGFEIKRIQGFFDLAYYSMRFDRMTEFLFAQWGPFVSFDDIGVGFKAINAGATQVNGLEASVALQGLLWGGKLQAFAGYNYVNAIALDPERVMAVDFYDQELSYQNTSTTVDGEALKYRPTHSLKADLMYTYGKWSIGYGLNIQSEMNSIDTAFVSNPIAFFVPGVDSAMNKHLTAFNQHNIRITYKPIPILRLGLIITNLSNQEFMIRPADLGTPRSLRFQISYTFQ